MPHQPQDPPSSTSPLPNPEQALQEAAGDAVACQNMGSSKYAGQPTHLQMDTSVPACLHAQPHTTPQTWCKHMGGRQDPQFPGAACNQKTPVKFQDLVLTGLGMTRPGHDRVELWITERQAQSVTLLLGSWISKFKHALYNQELDNLLIQHILTLNTLAFQTKVQPKREYPSIPEDSNRDGRIE